MLGSCRTLWPTLLQIVPTFMSGSCLIPAANTVPSGTHIDIRDRMQMDFVMFRPSMAFQMNCARIIMPFSRLQYFLLPYFLHVPRVDAWAPPCSALADWVQRCSTELFLDWFFPPGCITHETGRFVQGTVLVSSLFNVMGPGNVNSHGPLSPTCGTERSIGVDLYVILMICWII